MTDIDEISSVEGVCTAWRALYEKCLTTSSMRRCRRVVVTVTKCKVVASSTTGRYSRAFILNRTVNRKCEVSRVQWP